MMAGGEVHPFRMRLYGTPYILHADVLFKPYHHLHLTGTLCQMNHQTSLLQVRRNDPLEDQKMPTTLQESAGE
jgi:hypothetical protein